MLPNELLSQLIDNKNILVVQKDENLRFIDCNDAWIKAANFRNKSEIIGLTDRDCVWAEFSDIYETYEKDILAGQAYGLINPAFVENHRYCWLHNYKWPRLDQSGKIIGVNVIAYEVCNQNQNEFLFKLSKNNKFGINQFSVGKPINEHLTKKEKEILFYLCYGFSLKKISSLMGISKRTTELHISHIKSKFNCQNKSQIIEYAVIKGYVSILPGYIFHDFIRDLFR